MKLKARDLQVTVASDAYQVAFLTEDARALKAFIDGDFPPLAQVEITKQKQKRSLDANAYMWTLLDKIAAKHRTTGKEIYREIIQDVGVFDWVLVTPTAKDKFISSWQERGDGWIALEYPPRENGIPIKTIYGSSTYNTEEMSRLIDEVVEHAKAEHIETMTPDELAELKAKL